MQDIISFVNEQLYWEEFSPHRYDCHDPPHAARVGFYDDRSPPRRLAWVARSDPWKTTPAKVGFPGDAIPRRRLRWVVGSDILSLAFFKAESENDIGCRQDVLSALSLRMRPADSRAYR